MKIKDKECLHKYKYIFYMNKISVMYNHSISDDSWSE